MYSKKVRELILELPNRGILVDATHTAQAVNPVCGDITFLYLKVQEGVVLDCSFQAYGCPAAIAASAAVTQMCRNRAVEKCQQLTSESVLDYLGGLPSHKLHGADLAEEVLHKALHITQR